MTDPEAKSVVSSDDPLAAAKSNLRETVKWLATTFAAVAGVVLAGTSVSGIGNLSGARLVLAVVGGACGFVSLLVAFERILRLLTSDVFYLSQVEHNPDIKSQIQRHVRDIIPPEFLTYDDFISERDRAVAVLQDPTSAADRRQHATDFIVAADPVLSQLTYLGHFLLLKKNLENAKPKLFAASFCALVGFAVFAGASGRKTDPAPVSPGSNILIDIKSDSSAFATALKSACGAEFFVASMVPKEGLAGEKKIKLVTPKACAGVELVPPASLELLSGVVPKPSRAR